MEENKVECKCEKKKSPSIVVCLIVFVIAAVIGWFLGGAFADAENKITNGNETKEEQKESNKTEESNSNVESNSNTANETKPEVVTYTTTQLKGTYTVETDTYTRTIKLYDNGLFELEHKAKEAGGYSRIGNYVINNDTITFNNLVDQPGGGAVVVNKTTTGKINSISSITYEDKAFTKVDNGENNTLKSWTDTLNEYSKCTEV